MTASVIAAITAVFSAVWAWCLTAIETVIGVFWADGALTFMGVVLLIGLAFGLFFLFVRLVQNFLRLRT